MAPVEKKTIASWGAVMDNEDDLPLAEETIDGNIKKVIEYKKEDNKKYKIVKQYRLEKIKVHKNVSLRKKWAKYGAARDDPEGPNPSNTVVCEDVQLRFILNADDEQLENAREMEQDGLSKLASSNANVVKCRLCEMDHWTSKCPYKVHYEQQNELGGVANMDRAAGFADAGGAVGGKYVPPSKREGATKGPGDVLSMNKREDYTVRVTNLPEEITDSDIKELFKNIGEVSRIFLARDKITAKSKGYAFVSFRNKLDAAKAIKIVNGFGYANLILTVEWAQKKQLDG